MERLNNWLVVGVVLLCMFGVGLIQAKTPFDWMGYDAFDDVNDRMDAVNAENCYAKREEDLYLPEAALGSQMPKFNKLLTSVTYPNRTNLLHVHNMALNRAFFFSYVFQKLNESHQFMQQPGLMYYYFSTAADVSANEYSINGSAIFFDNYCNYATWYKNLPFNKTLPLFGPRAWRFDDYNDPTNWLREPTNDTIDIVDYGAGSQYNYTEDAFRTNQWYRKWLPDGWENQGNDAKQKHPYMAGIKYSNETGKFVDEEFKSTVFFGPPSPGIREEVNLPVVWTQPYFDCGKSNKWIVSAVAPIVDHLPRYLKWTHIRRQKIVAVATMDIDYLSLDFNPCPLGLGNAGPNIFGGTARCKGTTMCEPLAGWGFRRGGYQCVCRAGYRYPPWQYGPYQGIDIESATEEEYKAGFECLPVGLQQVMPIIRSNSTIGTPDYNPTGRKKRQAEDGKAENESLNEDKWNAPEFGTQARNLGNKLNKVSVHIRKMKKFLRLLGLQKVKSDSGIKLVPRQTPSVKVVQGKQRMKILPRYKRDDAHVREKRQAFDETAFDRMARIFAQKDSVTKDNCASKRSDELELPGDVAYNVEKQFSYQARTALRLSHFLSNFMQNIDLYEEYGNLRGDQPLNIELLFGEVFANVMGDLQMKGSGVFFDRDKFEGPDGKTREFFGPYAYRAEDEDNQGGPEGDIANTNFLAVDFAGFPTSYLDKPWFKFVKERWQSNTYGLTKYTEKAMIRSESEGISLRRFEMYPMYYHAPSEEDGLWSAPYFDCDGYVKDWIVTYSVPFFGLNSIRSTLEFKGVVTVDIKLEELDINQCPMDFYVPNAFKGTARCPYESTYCVPLPGLTFEKGGYKCECLVGFEYPFNDPQAWYFDGQTVEEEYRKKEQGLASRFETMKCRIAGASQVSHNTLLITLTILAFIFIRR